MESEGWGFMLVEATCVKKNNNIFIRSIVKETGHIVQSAKQSEKKEGGKV